MFFFTTSTIVIVVEILVVVTFISIIAYLIIDGGWILCYLYNQFADVVAGSFIGSVFGTVIGVVISTASGALGVVPFSDIYTIYYVSRRQV